MKTRRKDYEKNYENVENDEHHYNSEGQRPAKRLRLLLPTMDHRIHDAKRLLLASRMGNVEIAKNIVDTYKGFRACDWYLNVIDCRDHNGETPLYKACHRGYESIVGVLLEAGATVDLVVADGSTCMYVAAEYGYIRVLAALVQYGGDVNGACIHGYTPLHIAVHCHRLKAIQWLIDTKADVNHRSFQGSSPLYVASQCGNVAIATTLLDKGANVDLSRYDGFSALHMACQTGNASMVSALLDRGATVNHRMRPVKATPLHCASESGKLDVVKLLLARGADHSLELPCGRDATHLALGQSYHDIVQLLATWKNMRDLNRGVVTRFGWAYHDMGDWTRRRNHLVPDVIRWRVAAAIVSLYGFLGRHTMDELGGPIAKAMDCILRGRVFDLPNIGIGP